jgi:hypothetical protein
MTVSIAVYAIAIVGAGLAALGALAWIRLSGYRRTRRRSRPDEEFSPGIYQPMERYRPLARLLAGEDAEFLRRNTTCPKVVDRWERSRRRIIRLYLKELAADFQGLHAQARVLVAESPEQSAALLPLLFRKQVAFWRTLATIELRLAFGGLNAAQASIEEMVGVIEAMQREIARAATLSAA